MQNTNLVIAIVFASIFGTALLYLIIWYIYRYIHQRCLDLEHWFHVLWPYPPKHCVEKAEARETSKQRSRSRKRERGCLGSRQYYDREGNAEWWTQGDMQRARPTMPLDAPQQPYGQSYFPALGWQNYTQEANQMMYGHQMPWQIQGVAQMAPLAMPVAMSQQLFPQMAARIPEPAQYEPPYQARDRSQHRQAHAESTTSHGPKMGRHNSASVKRKLPRKAQVVEKVDYIHICDEYPPIVQEALKKADPPPPSSSSSSSCSSETSGTTQEVPRTSMPRATPHFASAPPFQFPQYPRMATRAWNTPRSYPRQWMGDATGGDRADVKARYAPFPPLSGRAERPYIRRRPAPSPAPSNTHPADRKHMLTIILVSGVSESRSRTYKRPKQRTVSPRGGGSQTGAGGHGGPNEKTDGGGEAEERAVNSEPSVEAESGGKNDEQDGQEPSVSQESTTLGEIPRFSPMPVPVVEEPSSVGVWREYADM